MIAVLAVVGVLGAFALARRPTLAEREARRRAIVRTESLEERIQRLAEEGNYYGRVRFLPDSGSVVVTAEALEGEPKEVHLPPGVDWVVFLLEDVRGESATLEASGVRGTVELRPEEGTRWGEIELPDGWEGRRRLTLRGAGDARLTFAAPPPGLGRKRSPTDPGSLAEALSREAGPLRDKGMVPVAELSGGGKDPNPYRSLSLPTDDLVLVWALDPRSRAPGSVAIDVTRRGYSIQSIAPGAKAGYAGTAPLRLQPGTYGIEVRAAGKWAVSVYRKI